MRQIVAKHSRELPADINNQLKDVDNKVKAYIAVAQKKLLKDPANVDPDSYFDQGTELISAIIKVYDSCNQAILKDSKGWI